MTENKNIRFIVSEGFPITLDSPLLIFWLKPKDWDDYTYKTTFDVRIITGEKKWKELGRIKIIKYAQQNNTWTKTYLAEDNLLHFVKLPETYCSLAVNKDFYSNLKEFLEVHSITYETVLDHLNDIYFSPEKGSVFENNKNPAFKLSLLRDSEGAYLFKQTKETDIPIKFNASIKLNGADAPHTFEMDFSPYKKLPHRIFVLIGENGVGKTQLLSRLAIAISGYEIEDSNYFTQDIVEPRGLFNNVISLSFSAYDNFEVPSINDKTKTSYRFCGIRAPDGTIIDTSALLRKTVETILYLSPDREDQFLKIATNIFPDLSLDALVPHKGFKDRHIIMATNTLLGKTSAGQRIALAVLANLVDKLDENSLVIFDEPETHLHPSLLTTIMSFMDKLLEIYKSYAIISTHSPLVLQQVPSRYIKRVIRIENTPKIIDIGIETFGENLTEISHNAFSINENTRDYKKTFIKLLEQTNNDVDAVAEMFEKGLSLSARSLLYTLAFTRSENA